MYHTAAYFCAAAALVLAVWGVVLAFRDEPGAATEEPAFVIDTPDRDLGTVPAGPVDVAFDITNPAGRPRRIIGFAEG
jgi:hypothetical protein